MNDKPDWIINYEKVQPVSKIEFRYLPEIQEVVIVILNGDGRELKTNQIPLVPSPKSWLANELKKNAS